MANIRTKAALRGPLQKQEYGFNPFRANFHVKTTDIVDTNTHLIYQFGSDVNARLATALTVMRSDELDTAIPTLTMSLGIGDADGVIDVALIVDADIAQNAAASPYATPDMSAAQPLVVLTNKFLILEFTAAAAAVQAGDIEVFGAWIDGLAAPNFNLDGS